MGVLPATGLLYGSASGRIYHIPSSPKESLWLAHCVGVLFGSGTVASGPVSPTFGLVYPHRLVMEVTQ